MERAVAGLAIALSMAAAGACGGHTRFSPDGGGGGKAGAPVGGLGTGDGGGVSGPGGMAGSAAAGGPGREAPGDPQLVWRSSGCGKPLPPKQVPTVPFSRIGYTEWHVTQTGATLGADNPALAGERQFFVRVPADYDPSRPYRVVYVGQGCGGLRAGDSSSLPLFDERDGGTEQAVYVALSLPDNDANPGCYDNNNGALSQEWEAFDLIHTFVEQTYCVDNDRIFVAGYSTGGWLANMWGCYFGGTPSPPLDQPDLALGLKERKFAPRWAIRGRASDSGSLPPNQPQPCNGPGAAIWLHDELDLAHPIETEIAALELALQTNGCTGSYAAGPKQAWPPAERIPELTGGICQLYTGCPAAVAEAYPLVFCTPRGILRGPSRLGTAAFTAFFQLMDPPGEP